VPLNQGCVYHHRVRPADAGASVIAFHVAHFRHTDEAGWRRSIAEGRVRINGRAAAADERIAAGDALEFHRRPWEEPEAPLEFGVVVEDEHVLVLEKPAGLQVLPAGPFHEHTLARRVRASGTARADSSRVHRLGRGTSGVILVGESALARAALTRALREGRVAKS
jgi:23S rRNA pseudouridine1911/1915/1917 synthase